eukprot:TRINITY_DN4338_c0_g1_i2.p1 TRINITY_DN4338_c0_g1~~TRINITY_DN4338_c0_g1_i2.p1  ORF type:complete len:209 (+),score=40.74 TRINITY_DN4338_c0_g1_i2:51-629(+)
MGTCASTEKTRPGGVPGRSQSPRESRELQAPKKQEPAPPTSLAPQSDPPQAPEQEGAVSQLQDTKRDSRGEKSGRSATEAERFMAMESFVSAMRDIAVAVVHGAAAGEAEGSVFYYLWHTDDLLREVRRRARQPAVTKHLQKAFYTYDEPPHDGVLDPSESTSFVKMYVRCYTGFVSGWLGRCRTVRRSRLQ